LEARLIVHNAWSASMVTPRTCPSVVRESVMSIVLTLKFSTALTLYVQLLMLIYLYSSHRERFFRYMV
jgi:hypothetical protein